MKGQKTSLSFTKEVSVHPCAVSKSALMRLSKSVTLEQKMESLIATALRTDLNMSVQISMKAVSNIICLLALTYCITSG